MEFNTIDYWKNQKGFPGLGGRKLKILSFLPNQGGCAYYRIILPSRKLEEHFSNVVEIKYTENPLGWENKDGKFEEKIDHDLFENCDIFWTNNIPNYGLNYLARCCGIAREHKKIFHFDTDDLLTELYDGHRLSKVYKEQGLSEGTKWIYNNSHLVTVTQRKFAERISQFMSPGTLLAVIKNAIDYNLPAWNAPKVQIPKNRFTRIGWAGGIHHEEDVKEFAGIPWLVNQKVGKENVRWDFYGKPPVDPKDKEKEKWQQDVWVNYERILCQGFKNYKNYTINSALPADTYGVMYSHFDVSIAPLQMNCFNDSKSDIKISECGRYKVPLVASNVGCYDEIIKNGVTGYLIDPKAPKSEWVRVLSKVIKDRDHREEMGRNLHAITEEVFNINTKVHERLDLYAEYFKHNPLK